MFIWSDDLYAFFISYVINGPEINTELVYKEEDKWKYFNSKI